jgi:hypothetical protein
MHSEGKFCLTVKQLCYINWEHKPCSFSNFFLSLHILATSERCESSLRTEESQSPNMMEMGVEVKLAFQWKRPSRVKFIAKSQLQNTATNTHCQAFTWLHQPQTSFFHGDWHNTALNKNVWTSALFYFNSRYKKRISVQ